MKKKKKRYNASDPSDVKAAGKVDEEKLAIERADMHLMLSSESGRRFLWKYLNECKIFETTFRDDVNLMVFLEGERNIGLKLLAEIMDADEASYLLMVKEAKIRKGQDDG